MATTSLLVERKFLHAGGRAGYLEDVAVHPAHRHRGFGTAVVRHACARAWARGCYKVVLHCRAELVPFYTGAGFRPHAEGLRQDAPPPTG